MKNLAPIALVALALCHGARAQEGITLAEAQRRAVDRAPQVAAADASIRAARELAVVAGRRPDPVLKLEVQNLPVTGPDRFSLNSDFMTMRSAGVMQEYTSGEKLERRTERFEREADKGIAERNAARASVQTETALAWIDRFYAERTADAVAEQREEALREVAASEAAYRGARASQADVLAARATIVALEDKLSEARRKVAVSSESLARWIGPPAYGPIAGVVNARILPAHAAEEHVAVEAHPDVEAASGAVALAQAELRVAEAERKPDFSWELMYNHRGSAFSDMVTFGVSMPLPWDRPNKQDREVAARRAQVDQAEARREEMVRAHVAEIRSMRLEWKDDLSRLDRYEREWLPLVRERTQAALAAYAGARGSLADVLAARRGELDTKLQRLQLELEAARVWARLAFLVPVDLPAKEVP
jgi:outer membrane protein TolC